MKDKITSKFIFITGGVVSSLGKGITAASIGLLLKSRGLKVINQKFDPYLNIDPGTMNPFQHGEVYVTEDGGKRILTLGTMNVLPTFRQETQHDSGQGVSCHLDRGGTGVSGKHRTVIPHVTDEIRIVSWTRPVKRKGRGYYRSGWAVGDIESLPFIEATVRFNIPLVTVIAFHSSGALPYLKECRNSRQNRCSTASELWDSVSSRTSL